MTLAVLIIKVYSVSFLFLVSLVVENEEIKELLEENGIPSQTQQEAYPVRVLPAKCLGRIYGRLGKHSVIS